MWLLYYLIYKTVDFKPPSFQDILKYTLNSKFQNSEIRTNIDCWRTTPIAELVTAEERRNTPLVLEPKRLFWSIQVTPIGGRINHCSIYIFWLEQPDQLSIHPFHLQSTDSSTSTTHLRTHLRTFGARSTIVNPSTPGPSSTNQHPDQRKKKTSWIR